MCKVHVGGKALAYVSFIGLRIHILVHSQHGSSSQRRFVSGHKSAPNNNSLVAPRRSVNVAGVKKMTSYVVWMPSRSAQK